MKKQMMFLAITAMLVGTACSSQPKEAAPEATPVATEPAPPAPTNEVAKGDVQACEGKAARDACNYTSEKGEVKGTCVRSETFSLHCLPKKAKKK